MTKPLSPAEALKSQASAIPDAVFDVFNAFLSNRYSDGCSVTIKQNEVVDALVARRLDRADIFEKRWLDVEPHYRKAGWLVEYDKPGYCESYDAFWMFTKRRSRAKDGR